jgi:hypothetical protein
MARRARCALSLTLDGFLPPRTLTVTCFCTLRLTTSGKPPLGRETTRASRRSQSYIRTVSRHLDLAQATVTNDVSVASK